MKQFRFLSFILTIAVAIALLVGIPHQTSAKDEADKVDAQLDDHEVRISDNTADLQILNNLLGQICPEGEYVTGIDSSGVVLCAPAPQANLLPGYVMVRADNTTNTSYAGVSAECPSGKIAIAGGGHCYHDYGEASEVPPLHGVYSYPSPVMAEYCPTSWSQICMLSDDPGVSLRATAFAICIDDLTNCAAVPSP